MWVIALCLLIIALILWKSTQGTRKRDQHNTPLEDDPVYDTRPEVPMRSTIPLTRGAVAVDRTVDEVSFDGDRQLLRRCRCQLAPSRISAADQLLYSYIGDTGTEPVTSGEPGYVHTLSQVYLE
jgi:hypothetical protein